MHRNIDDIIFRVDANTNLPSGAPRASRVCNASCITCTQVTIQNDFILEDLYETFSLSLSHADPSVHVTSSEASVSIQDNDSKCIPSCVLGREMVGHRNIIAMSLHTATTECVMFLD